MIKIQCQTKNKMNYSETSVQCAQQLQSPTICNSSSPTSPTTQNRLRRLLSRFPSWILRVLESLTPWNDRDSISHKAKNELLRDVSPMRSTTAESNDSQPHMSNVSNDTKSSSNITFAFSQLDLKSSRVSHIIE